jgi:hypothetical protein
MHVLRNLTQAVAVGEAGARPVPRPSPRRSQRGRYPRAAGETRRSHARLSGTTCFFPPTFLLS